MDNPFLHFDVASVARELRLEERGAQNGAQNIPPADARSPDAVEQEVMARIQRAWQHATSEADRWFLACDQRISNLSLLTQLPTIESSALQTEGQIKATVAQATLRLTTARDAVTQSYQQLRAFQREHGLNRPAKLVPSAASTYGTIALTWLAETLVNSILLRQNDDLGLIGGIMAAAAIGLINVFVAVMVGRSVLPQLNTRSKAKPVFIALAVIWGLFVAGWNLFAALYRDAKVAGTVGPEFAALDMMPSMPASFYSWALLILGCVFAIVAASAAYRIDDPFPGYGMVWREHEQRCGDYAGEIEAVSDDLAQFHDEASEAFGSLRKGLAQQLDDQNRARNGRNAFSQRLNRFHAELEQAGSQLLATYRDANRATRSDPVPPHFEAAFTLPPPNIPPAPDAAVTPAHVEQADRVLSAAQKGISDAYVNGVTSFETLEALKARLPA